MSKSKSNEPDGNRDVSDGIARLDESKRGYKESAGNPNVQSGLTSLTGSGGKTDGE